jgi:phosphoglycerate kinase
MPKQNIDHTDVASKRVLMRVDFNVPQDEAGNITDDRRIALALPSIRSAIERGGRLVLMSHLGRPEGKGFEAEWSMRPAAQRLGELLPGVKVALAGKDPADDDAKRAIDAMHDGEIVVLENLRFNKGEKKGLPEFAQRLASFGDIYCNEAFGTAHRNDGSMFAVPQAMEGKPRVAGLLLSRELTFLGDTLANPKRPFVAVLGGAKVSDKIGAIDNLLARVDTILVGGAMAYTLLAAQGHAVGSSLVERDRIDDAKRIIAAAAGGRAKLLLPVDHICGKALEPGTPTMNTEGADIDDGWMGLDIGPRTRESFVAAIKKARTIVWNGPMGAFETRPFDAGTRHVAEAMAAATTAGAISVVGGGDSAAAVEDMGLAASFSHVSTGGGASLQMLEGRAFDSVGLLDDG